MWYYCIVQIFGGGKLWQIPVCLLSLFISQNIVKIWMVKFGEPPVICQGFPPPKIHAIWHNHDMMENVMFE